MKITLVENDGCFAFNAMAETLEEAALLTRFGMNATRHINSLNATVGRDGTFIAAIVVAKHKQANNYIPHR